MNDKKAILGVAIGSFDLLSGVKVVESWTPEDNLPVPFEDIFKMVLSNVHRQSEESFNTFVTSIT